MFKESKISKEAEQKDIYEKAGEYIEKLLPELKEISEELKEKNFPVDEVCRINTEAFKDIFGERVIMADQKIVEKTERKFLEKENKNIGELLETVKTIAFNKLWFKERLISLRTSKFDDYFNGVDEVIFDTETHQPLAAVDTTTNINEKIEKMIDKIKKGSQVKYGFYIKDNIRKGSLNDLPTFIISLKPEELLEFTQKIINHFEGEQLEQFDLKTREHILESLKLQSEKFQEIADYKMKHSYEIAGQIFDDLLKS